MIRKWLIALVVCGLLVPCAAWALEETQEEAYARLKIDGLKAIKNRKPFTLRFVEEDNIEFKILKIRFKGDFARIFIRDYTPQGRLRRKWRFKLIEFEGVLNQYKKLKYSIYNNEE